MISSAHDRKTSDRRAVVFERFEALFGGEPSVVGRAPGRVDLMGSHTDYNLGHVMTMTLDRDTWIAARPRDDRRVVVHSLNLDATTDFSLGRLEPDAAAPWSNYVRGVAAVLQDAGHVLIGFDAVVHSTVPLGGGLSSSAALEVATAVVFQRVGDFALDPVEVARLAQRAENEFVGVNCGILDQYSSAMGRAGRALLLDCRDLTSVSVPLHPDLRVVISDTRAPRNLSGTEYDERRRQCDAGVRALRRLHPKVASLRDGDVAMLEAHRDALPAVVWRRCRFIVEENARALRLAEALPGGEPGVLREVFEASYLGARDLYEVGAPAMDAMMQAMTGGPGVVAARQAGAGFGGCMVALVDAGGLEPFVTHVTRDYQRRTGVRSNVYAVTPSEGAGLL